MTVEDYVIFETRKTTKTKNTYHIGDDTSADQ